MEGWELIQIDGNGIELKINFTKPLLISSDDEPDVLLIQLNLSELKDDNGISLPKSVVK